MFAHSPDRDRIQWTEIRRERPKRETIQPGTWSLSNWLDAEPWESARARLNARRARG